MKEVAFINDPVQLDFSFRRLYQIARQAIQAGQASVLELREPSKSRDQERMYHDMIGEIAHQSLLYGKKLSAESWKRLLVDAFKHDTKDDPELKSHWDKFGDLQLLPALNHPGFVTVGEQTRKFSRKLASAFIEWLYAYGSQNGVRFSAKQEQA